MGAPLFILGMVGYLPALTSFSGQVIWFFIGMITLAVLIYSGRQFYKGAWHSFRAHNANMDTLIALGTGTAWVYSLVITIAPDVVPTLAQHAYFEAAVIIVAAD